MSCATDENFNPFNERCWRQNILSGVHTAGSTILLLTAILGDSSILGERRLYPHDNLILYLDISMSLGYFSFSLPMAYYMAFTLRAGFPYGSSQMVFHHGMVVIAQATFLLTQYPSAYMAASGLLFELTNVVYIPHVLMIQLNAPATARTMVGLALAVVYTLARCIVCTALAVISFGDLREFSPPTSGAWVAALLGLCCFYGLLLLSWYWYFTAIVPSIHEGLAHAFGRQYYRACCPRRVRLLAWRRFTAEGREEEELQRARLKALQELREEAAAALTADCDRA